MSDVSKTNEDLIADALEATTRVPAQGEPNDDREALEAVIDSERRGWTRMGSGLSSELANVILAAGFSRDAVPDAATEKVQAENSVRHVKRLTTELQNKREALNDQRREYRALLSKRDRTIDGLRAERDAALAAVERVRVRHEKEPVNSNYGGTRDICLACEQSWPCPTIAALDGAPEPEWEYVGLAFEHGGFMRIQNDQLTPEKFESWLKLMTKYPRVEILKRVKAVPTGPWLPVEGEKP